MVFADSSPGGNNGTFNLEIGGVYASCTANITSGVWTNVAWSFNNTARSAKCYMNGNFVNEVSGYNVNPPVPKPSPPWPPFILGARTEYVGEKLYGADYGFAGLMDEVVFWNRPLNGSEIMQMYEYTG